MDTNNVDWVSIGQKVYAWDKLADHPFFKSCYSDYSGSLLDMMLKKLDDLYEGESK